MDDNKKPEAYASLLQPIRMLAENWNIDIAAELEDYLEELENLTITFDGGKTNFNFAQAALVIQGSACIYSKKVEYLYSLVFTVLEHLSEKRKNNNNNNKTGGHDQDHDEEAGDEVEEKFLPLDDVQVVEEEDIDLVEDQEVNRSNRNIGFNSMPSQPSLVNDPFNNIVINLPYEDHALISADVKDDNNENININNNNYNYNHANFKLSTCALHPSGALLLDVADHILIGGGYPLPQGKAAFTPVKTPNKQANSNDSNNNNNNNNIITDDHGDGGTDDHSSDGGGDIGGGMDFGFNDNASFGSSPFLDNNDNNNNELVAGSTTPSSKLAPPASVTTPRSLADALTTPKRSSTARQSPATANKDKDSTLNIWEPLDPHLEDNLPKKPFKKRQTYKEITRQVLDSFKTSAVAASVFSSQQQQQQQQQQQWDFPSAYLYKKGMPINKLSMTGVYHSEFNFLLDIEKKRRRAIKKKILDSLAVTNPAGQQAAYLDDDEEQEVAPAVAQDAPHNNEAVIAGGGGLDDPMSDGDDDDNHFGDFGGVDFDNDVNGPPNTSDINNNNNGNANQDILGGNGEISDITMMNNYTGAIDSVMQSYEDLCRMHLENFAQTAEQYAQETQLTKRVQEWQNRIIPYLERQEKIGAFDIHKYGEQILAKFEADEEPNTQKKKSQQGKKSVMTFGEVVRGKEVYDVCRNFLALLQLANNGNVEIEPVAQHDDESADTASATRKKKKKTTSSNNNGSKSFDASVIDISDEKVNSAQTFRIKLITKENKFKRIEQCLAGAS